MEKQPFIKYYSSKTAISFFVQAVFFLAPYLCILVVGFANEIELAAIIFPALFLLPFFLGFSIAAFYHLKKITITDKYIRISRFGKTLKEFPVDSIVDIRAIFIKPTNKIPQPPVTISFSKTAIPDCLPPKDERENYKETQIKFLFEEWDIDLIKDYFSVPIRELRLNQPKPIVEPVIPQNEARKIAITRGKRFWACGVPLYFCIDGQAAAFAKNGKTAEFLIDQNEHELYAVFNLLVGPRSAIVHIPAGNDDLRFNFTLNPSWWKGYPDLFLTQEQ